MSKGQYIGYCRYCKQQIMRIIRKNGKLTWKRKLLKNVSAREHLPGGMLKEEYATQKTGA